MLPVMERFHSLQGEGAHCGRSAFFIRLAYCKVGCPWCDTKKSWSAELHPKENIIQLSLDAVKAQADGAGFVVLTGGEPLHHNLTPLCKAIRKYTTIDGINPMPIHLETSGVDQITGSPDWITLSPKRHAPPRLEALKLCQELKVIVHEEEDLMFAEDMADKTQKSLLKETLLFLQPGWNNKKGHQLAIQYVRHNPKWRLSMQTHKLLGVQ